MGGQGGMSASIRVSQLSKTFALAEHGGGPVSLIDALRSGRPEIKHRHVRALSDMSFEIGEGERVGIIGRNGAGKTTLLSLIAGIAEPSSGSIEIEGDVHAILTIGAVLREEATGRENIYLDGAIHGKDASQIEAHVEEIIAFAELGEFIDRPVRTYSSGMKARLAFSMAAFVDPDILIIDETLSVGDAFFAEKAQRRMKEIAAKGRIVMLVSHGLASIVEMCDRCLWLDQGRLVMDGKPKAVTDAYLASSEQQDEASLAAKFDSQELALRRPEAGGLDRLGFVQDGKPVAATIAAFMPLAIEVAGHLDAAGPTPDVELRILRVDGRLIWSDRLSLHQAALPQAGPFKLDVALEPFLLGVNLYRFEAVLMDAQGPIDAVHRALEVVDEAGQFGGVPLLFHPPVITATAIKDA